jgi:hypothetical protein
MTLGAERFQYTALLLTWPVLLHGLPLEFSSKPALAMVGRTAGGCSVVEAISVEVDIASVVVVTSALVVASVVAADSAVEDTSDDSVTEAGKVVSMVVVVKSTATEELIVSVEIGTEEDRA